MLTISHSSAQAHARCNYCYYLSKILGLRKYDHYKSPALKLGSAWDKAQEQYNTSLDIELDDIVNQYSISEYDYAKVIAMLVAQDKLGLATYPGTEQQPIEYKLDNAMITGYIDCNCDDYFIERKFTSRPDWYYKIPNIRHQIGTYFLATDSDYCIIQAARCPALKYKDGEEFEEYVDRMVADIMSRPAYYYYRLDSNGNWGYKINRAVIDVEYLKLMYTNQIKDIKHKIENNNWYMNEAGCLNPFECDYYDGCRTGVISEEVYYINK